MKWEWNCKVDIDLKYNACSPPLHNLLYFLKVWVFYVCYDLQLHFILRLMPTLTKKVITILRSWTRKYDHKQNMFMKFRQKSINLIMRLWASRYDFNHSFHCDLALIYQGYIFTEKFDFSWLFKDWVTNHFHIQWELPKCTSVVWEL